MSQKAFLGHTAIADLKAQLAELKPERLFLVRGNRSYATCGAEAVLAPLFLELGVQVSEYKDFSVNPKMEEAEAGVECLLDSQADCILAVGGGSVMDMAKLIRHFAAAAGKKLPLLAAPTTAGTGAEATRFAVVYVGGKKQSIDADDILPDMAFVYPPFTYGNGAYLTACTGFDALAQAYEASWNKNATKESSEFAQKAIALLQSQLPECVQQPTEQLRDDIAIGAYWAGRAINITRTTAPHAFSYAFTSKCGYPHGHAVALTFPFFAALNLGNNENYSFFREYVDKIGLTYNGVGEHDLRALLGEVNLQRLANNPVAVGEEEIEKLLRDLNTRQI